MRGNRTRWTRRLAHAQGMSDGQRLFSSCWHIKGLKGYPFKGKGEALRRMDELHEARQRLYAFMEDYSHHSSALLGQFQIYLDVVRSKDLPSRLRWRSPKVEGGKQNWNVITENPWMLQRPAEVIEMVGRVHRRVAQINAVSRMITAELGLLRQYLSMIESVGNMRLRAGLPEDNPVDVEEGILVVAT